MSKEAESISMGTIIAIVLSWGVNHSILWCIIHGICGWFYVIYYMFKYYYNNG